jgi:poly(A) polymerase
VADSDQQNGDLAAYAGRWVALIEGKVAGVGHTAVAATRMARRNRPKEKLSLRFVEPAGGEPLALSPLLERLRPLLAQEEEAVYLVGGAVRDALLGRVSNDLDFAVAQNAIALAFRVADALGLPAYVLDRERDTGRVVLPDEETTLDFARFRGHDLEADLRDRDFTINALALPAAAATGASLIDPTGGRADLAAGLLHPTHERALQHDPVRALRAVRLALSFDLSLTDDAETAVREAAPLLQTASIERVRDELLKALAGAAPERAVREMQRLLLLPVVLPEIAALAGVAQSAPHHEEVLPHTIRVLSWLARLEAAILQGEEPDSPVVARAQVKLAPYTDSLRHHFARHVPGDLDGRIVWRLGALFHDVGKAETQTMENGRIRFLGHDKVGAKIAARRLRALRFSNEAADHARRIVDGHMRPLFLSQNEQVSRRAVYRFFKSTSTAGLDIGLIALADHLATYDAPEADVARTGGTNYEKLLSVVTELYRHYFERYEETVRPRPLLDGQELIRALHLTPGPEVGRLLRLLEEAQAAGHIHTREEALAFARRSRGE